VLHNFRVGVAERLRIDEAAVTAVNPGAVYCHASAFGPTGPRVKYPGNDALMQALTGLERSVGGAGNDPIAATWIPIDMSGGWIAASGILAGLYARAGTGAGQRVTTSLLAAGMLLQSGVFQRDGQVVRGPELDAEQTGYGPGYRIYRASDGGWLAVVIPDPDAWAAVRALPEVAGLPERYAPLRGHPEDERVQAAETVLVAAIGSDRAEVWTRRLRHVGCLVEPVREMDRDQFRRGILDDPDNRQLGRVVAYETEDWGHFEQIGPLIRCGPGEQGRPRLMLPGIGSHSAEVLADLGFSNEEIDNLLAAKVVRQA
jgi:crotonobetainyl-CoA:carnitine CoA-transferase CaiB-like acyl-CoA transferase